MNHCSTNRRGIVGLTAVLLLGLFTLGSAFSVATANLIELSKNKNVSSGARSFQTAEAAAREGAYQYLHDQAYTGSAFSAMNGSVAQTVAVTPLDWPYFETRGTASNQTARRAVVNTLTVFPEGLAFDYATYAEHDLSIGGNVTIDGNIFSNGTLSFIGNKTEIDGDAYSAEPIADTNNVNGDAYGGVSPIPPPQIDTTPYFTAANSGGTLFSDPNDAETYVNGEVRNAVVYVQSSAPTHIQGSNTALTGSLVTEGDLDLSGGTYSASGNYAAIIVRGNLKIAGGATINGIVYVNGATSFGGGNNVINGALISAGGDISQTDITGSAVVNFDPVAMAKWKELEGLDTESSEAPRIIRWDEE